MSIKSVLIYYTISCGKVKRIYVNILYSEKLIALFGKILSIEAKFTKKPQKEDCHILEVSKIEYLSFSAKFFAFWQNRRAYKVR